MGFPNYSGAPRRVSDPNPQTDTTPKKSSFGCLKILAIFAVLAAICFAVVVIICWQAVSWVKNAPEAAAATYPPLNLSPGETEDVQRIIQELYTAKANQAVVDEYVTPEVFNGVVERMLEDEKKKKKSGKKEGPIAIRAGFAGDDLEIKGTLPYHDEKTSEDQFINFAVVGKLEIEDGKLTDLALNDVKIHDQTPPLIVRMWMNVITNGFRQGKQNDPNMKSQQKSMEAIKTMKREGDRVHFVLDGSKFKD